MYTSEFCSPIVNKVREQIAGQSATREDLIPLFRREGIKTLNLIYALAGNCFTFNRKGRTLIYTIPKDPIHISRVRRGLEEYDKVMNRYKEDKAEDLVSLEEAIEIVKRHGYKIFYEV